MSGRRPVKIESVVGDAEPSRRQPDLDSGSIPITQMGELLEQLDEHSSPEAWLLGARLQYTYDKHLRDLDWWFRKVWRPNGCNCSLSEIKRAAQHEKWSKRRAEVWDRVFEHVEERFAEEQAEHALTVVKKLKGVEAIMLEMLLPRVVIVEGPDGVVREEFELKVQPKSYEGMVRALKDIMTMRNEVQTTGRELVTGARRSDEAQTVGDGEGENRIALGVLQKHGTLRKVANMIAVKDGGPSGAD